MATETTLLKIYHLGVLVDITVAAAMGLRFGLSFLSCGFAVELLAGNKSHLS